MSFNEQLPPQSEKPIVFPQVNQGETFEQYKNRTQTLYGTLFNPDQVRQVRARYDSEISKINVENSRKTYLSPIGRYSVTSPAFGGTQTNSVRDLTKREVETLTARGYSIVPVPPGTSLRPPVNLTTKRYGYVVHQKRTFAGLPRTYDLNVQRGQTIVKRKATKTRAQRRLTQEPTTQYHKEFKYTGGSMFSEPVKWYIVHGQRMPLTQAAVDYYERIGVRVQRVSGGRSPGSSPSRTPTRSSSTTSTPVGTATTSAQKDQTIQELTSELRNLKNWIQEVNTRLSDQTIQLGESTTARSQEIQKNSEWTKQQIDRINEQLVALGNAVTDAAKASASIKAENTLKQVENQVKRKLEEGAEGAKGLTSGITSFFTQPSNIILIVIVVMMLVLLKK